MGKIYCMSDIHGFDAPFCARMSQLGEFHTIGPGGDTLVVLGDCIDGGPKSRTLLLFLHDLQRRRPEHCIVLRGNHEEDFLAWLDTYTGPGAGKPDEYDLLPWSGWLREDADFRTLRSFLSEDQWDRFCQALPTLSNNALNTLAAQMVLERNGELISWMRKLPYYYETDRQIFVHAGINENSGDLWRHGTPKNFFVEKFPATMGTFEKDIIAGHIGTNSLVGGRGEFYDVLWDGESHYFCDGTVWESGKLPVLVYDTDTEKYYALGDDEPVPPGGWPPSEWFRVRGALHPVKRCPKEWVAHWKKKKKKSDEDWF